MINCKDVQRHGHLSTHNVCNLSYGGSDMSDQKHIYTYRYIYRDKEAVRGCEVNLTTTQLQ